MTKLDDYITNFYLLSEIFPVCPSKLKRKENSLDERKSLVETLPGDLDNWVSFEVELANAFQYFDSNICIIMGKEWGFTASYPGHPPDDYVKPGGKAEHGHRTDYTNIQTSKDVIDHGDARKCKSSRRSSLYSRQVNYINHTLTHRCQAY